MTCGSAPNAASKCHTLAQMPWVRSRTVSPTLGCACELPQGHPPTGSGTCAAPPPAAPLCVSVCPSVRVYCCIVAAINERESLQHPVSANQAKRPSAIPCVHPTPARLPSKPRCPARTRHHRHFVCLSRIATTTAAVHIAHGESTLLPRPLWGLHIIPCPQPPRQGRLESPPLRPQNHGRPAMHPATARTA
jgi:hypothetical protein